MGLRGITDLYGQTTAGRTGAGAREAQGAPADPAHSQWGDAAGPNWDISQGLLSSPQLQAAYDPDWELVGESLPAIQGAENSTLDRTPDSHAAPYPRQPVPGGVVYGHGGPEEQWEAQEASWIIHGEDLGAWRQVIEDHPAGHHSPETWINRYAQSQGDTLLVPVPGQLKGNGGSGKDTAQGYGTEDGYGYFDAHIQTPGRVQTDPVPFRFFEPGERPFIVPRPAAEPTYDGPDSPYGAQGDTTQGMALGVSQAAVESLPTPYVAPPDPATAPASASSAEAAMIGEGDW